MLCFDAAALGLAARSRRLAVALALIPAGGSLALLLAAIYGEDFFGVLRLFAWGVFLHGIIVIVGMGAILRPRFRRWAFALFACAALLALIALDAFIIEPRMLTVSRVSIVSARITAPIRIAVISDLQTDRIDAYQRRVFERVMAERPDLILLPGDYVQHPDPAEYARLVRELNALLRDVGLTAPLGVHAVAGNVEHGAWPAIFDGLDARAYVQTEHVNVGEIELVPLSFRDSMYRDIRIPPSERFQLVFGHYPDFALGDVPADLLVAGHTHGGQVRLPLIGPIYTLSQVPRAWAAGVTDRGEGRALVVSRGIGMERKFAPRLRFLCPPELVMITIEPRED